VVRTYNIPGSKPKLPLISPRRSESAILWDAFNGKTQPIRQCQTRGKPPRHDIIVITVGWQRHNVYLDPQNIFPSQLGGRTKLASGYLGERASWTRRQGNRERKRVSSADAIPSATSELIMRFLQNKIPYGAVRTKCHGGIIKADLASVAPPRLPSTNHGRTIYAVSITNANGLKGV